MIGHILEHIIVVSLSSFIITFMLVEDLDGPFDIFRRIRNFVTKMDENGNYVDKVFGPMFKCHWCLGTWVSFIISIIYMTCINIIEDGSFGIVLFEWFFVFLSSMSVSGILHEFVMNL